MVLASVQAEGWPDALPLLPHPAELIVGLIAFAILYWIYATKVVPKMEAMYEERAAAIEGGMAQAEEAQAEAKAALDKYNAQLAGARTEANEIREEARNGRTFLWHTTETDELDNCDRVYVFRNGRIVAELGRAEITEEKVIQSSFHEAGG